jgi:hypothetical protein
MLFSFGKKRRSVRKSSKKGSKPPAKLLKVCKRLRVKATVKRGGKRVYKKKSVLKKLCLRKLRILKKKKMMLKKKHLAKKKARKVGGRRRKGSRRVKRVRSRMGDMEFGARSKYLTDMYAHIMKFGRRTRFGAGSSCGGMYSAPMTTGAMSFGRNISFGGQNFGGMEFGKPRKSPKMSKAAAMKAFKTFYRRHCAVRRSRFGNGGNPPLNASMGYEFCPSGMGGVLGATSTGLFPSPCKVFNPMEKAAEDQVILPAYEKPPAGKTSFGKRRRVSRKSKKVPKTKKGLKKALAKCHKMLKRKVRKVSRRKY